MTEEHEYNPLDLLSSIERDEARKREEIRAIRVFNDDIHWLMSGPRGRRLVDHFLTVCGVWKSSYTGDNEILVREGMRIAGLSLLHPIMQRCPDALITMFNERNQPNGSATKQ